MAEAGRVVTAGIWAALAVIIFWAGFGLGRVSRTPRGRRHAGRAGENGPPAGTAAPPGPAGDGTEPHSAAEPSTTVSSATLDEWADRWHGAPVEDIQLPPLPARPVVVSITPPPPRNVVWSPAAAAAQLPSPLPSTTTERAIAGWYWHEYVRTEQELWGPQGIDGPWEPGSVAAHVSTMLDTMAPVSAAALPAMAAAAAAGMAAL